MDELERELSRLGQPRPLPETLRQRLETALTGTVPEAAQEAGAQATGAQVAGTHATEGNPLAGIDGPRPLPTALDERLTASLTVEAAPLPRRLRRRVAAALAPNSGGRRPALTALAAAAAVVLLAATAATLVRAGGSGREGRKSAAAVTGAAPTAGAGGVAVSGSGAAGVPSGLFPGRSTCSAGLGVSFATKSRNCRIPSSFFEVVCRTGTMWPSRIAFGKAWNSSSFVIAPSLKYFSISLSSHSTTASVTRVRRSIARGLTASGRSSANTL